MSPDTAAVLRSQFQHDPQRARALWAKLRRWLLRSLFVVRQFKSMAEARDRARAAVQSGAVKTGVASAEDAAKLQAHEQGHSAFLSDAAVRVRRKLSNDARVTAAIRAVWNSMIAFNEDAFSYLTEEEDMAYLKDGSVPLATDQVGDFISDAEWAHLSSALV